MADSRGKLIEEFDNFAKYVLLSDDVDLVGDLHAAANAIAAAAATRDLPGRARSALVHNIRLLQNRFTYYANEVRHKTKVHASETSLVHARGPLVGFPEALVIIGAMNETDLRIKNAIVSVGRVLEWILTSVRDIGCRTYEVDEGAKIDALLAMERLAARVDAQAARLAQSRLSLRNATETPLPV
ncbi:hypothetical protein A3E39_04465 [Candidatus Uhrbacteria bacterium RIFCSPHIGHO2_12_FULL_60_25]|uniref:Uncharacterized protein n=1 Tax=Candidatus Uhrbacteria bacterium RIFCSPHIGHO2_12_FULL_60_25 TaxID=1802399 RepID=A0A1F7UIM3_9BACT|nr:MAG: hypothetical protein A3D73_01015 [Candidatus Uhrbacteria bacterium RIFCSPHIGHO2_02_FULL_60_44]OGL78140.1 MAG: hypothetical protein A3E39_04465 [Candidatus Uhrbacteria bacterium RIFCSPHIGHO2_12_FULL_60_25]